MGESLRARVERVRFVGPSLLTDSGCGVDLAEAGGASSRASRMFKSAGREIQTDLIAPDGGFVSANPLILFLDCTPSNGRCQNNIGGVTLALNVPVCGGLVDPNCLLTTAIGFADQRGVRVFDATVKARLSTEPLGAHGFGYDPIVIPDD